MGPEKELILHIGRSKSGTSTLQRYLTHYRPVLASEGICYPETGCSRGYAHHALADACRAILPYRRDLRALRRAFEEETAPYDRIIVSSEGFQQVLFRYNIELFFRRQNTASSTGIFSLYSATDGPVSYRIKTICYLREYLEYVCSSYTQNVQNSNQIRSLARYCDKHFSRTLSMFVSLWRRMSDETAFLAYDRRKLVRQDIVEDFFNQIGVALPGPDIQEDANPSISGNLLAFKLLVNRHIRHSRDLYRTFGELALLDRRYRGRMYVSDALAREFRHHKQCYNSYLAELVGPVEESSFENGNRFEPALWNLDMERFLDHPNLSSLKDCPEIFRTSANDAKMLLPY